jgi:hypothetical protein
MSTAELIRFRQELQHSLPGYLLYVQARAAASDDPAQGEEQAGQSTNKVRNVPT